MGGIWLLDPFANFVLTDDLFLQRFKSKINLNKTGHRSDVSQHSCNLLLKAKRLGFMHETRLLQNAVTFKILKLIAFEFCSDRPEQKSSTVLIIQKTKQILL